MSDYFHAKMIMVFKFDNEETASKNFDLCKQIINFNIQDRTWELIGTSLIIKGWKNNNITLELLYEQLLNTMTDIKDSIMFNEEDDIFILKWDSGKPLINT